MERKSYTYNDYSGKNKFGWDCHIYELRKNGKVIYKFNNEIQDDGSEIQSGVDHFYEKAEKIMDAGVDESISRPI